MKPATCRREEGRKGGKEREREEERERERGKITSFGEEVEKLEPLRIY